MGPGDSVLGLAEAYQAYTSPLSNEECDGFHAAGAPIGRAFGAIDAPSSVAETECHFKAIEERLAATDAIFAILKLLRGAPFLPPALRPLQGLMIHGGVALVPRQLRPASRWAGAICRHREVGSLRGSAAAKPF